MILTAEDVLLFWFPATLGTDPERVLAQVQWWFRGGADKEIIEKFPQLLNDAEMGKLTNWRNSPHSRLALIIVLDQFSRSIYRGSAKAYSNDPEALSITVEGLECGHYESLESPWERTFFTLPLAHSENLANLDLAVKLADAIADAAPAELKSMLEFSAAQAKGHRDVVRRFGRHPHRNEVLGRQSTVEELEYLASGDLVHARPIPR